jgi:phage N-6-adenine-methyltransferase
MPVSPVMFTSRTDEWATPPETFKELDREFGFDLDVCATHENAKCDRYFTRDDNGLAQPWAGVCWMNPLYGREIGQWMRKAKASADAGQPWFAWFPLAPTPHGGTTTQPKGKSVLFVAG